MIRNTILVLFAVLLVTVFLAACHPHRWHRGCEIDGPFGSDQNPRVSEHVIAGNFHADTADLL